METHDEKAIGKIRSLSDDMENIIGDEESYGIEPQDFIEMIGGWKERVDDIMNDVKEVVRDCNKVFENHPMIHNSVIGMEEV